MSLKEYSIALPKQIVNEINYAIDTSSFSADVNRVLSNDKLLNNLHIDSENFSPKEYAQIKKIHQVMLDYGSQSEQNQRQIHNFSKNFSVETLELLYSILGKDTIWINRFRAQTISSLSHEQIIAFGKDLLQINKHQKFNLSELDSSLIYEFKIVQSVLGQNYGKRKNHNNIYHNIDNLFDINSTIIQTSKLLLNLGISNIRSFERLKNISELGENKIKIVYSIFRHLSDVQLENIVNIDISILDSLAEPLVGGFLNSCYDYNSTQALNLMGKEKIIELNQLLIEINSEQLEAIQELNIDTIKHIKAILPLLSKEKILLLKNFSPEQLHIIEQDFILLSKKKIKQLQYLGIVHLNKFKDILPKLSNNHIKNLSTVPENILPVAYMQIQSDIKNKGKFEKLSKKIQEMDEGIKKMNKRIKINSHNISELSTELNSSEYDIPSYHNSGENEKITQLTQRVNTLQRKQGEHYGTDFDEFIFLHD